MQLTIEAVSKNKKGILANGIWYNADKKANISFDDLQKGQTIEVVANENWIKSFKNADGSAPAASKSPSGSPSMPQTASQTPVNTSIARCTAVKSVLGSQAIADMTKEMSDSESFSIINQSIKVYANYILTGEFVDEVPF